MPHYNRKDHFYNKAKKEGYPARSAYKLIEMDKKFGILKRGVRIVDLGSAPGGWLKVVEKKLVDRGSQIIGLDLLPLQYKPKEETLFIQGDFLDESNQQKVLEALHGKANWVLSDMSPNLSGIKFKDLSASMELAESALIFAQKVLIQDGGFIVKLFPGPESGLFNKKLKKYFKQISQFIPDSTRKTSDEVYLVCVGFKGMLTYTHFYVT